MEEKLTLLKPKIDVVFHALFKEDNEKINISVQDIIKATGLKEEQILELKKNI